MSTLKLEHIAHIDNAGPDISIDSSGHLNIVNGNLQMGGVTMLDASSGDFNTGNNASFNILDVGGEVSGRIRNWSSPTNSIAIESDPSNSAAGSYLTFTVDGAQKMTILGNNVGIGTTSPSTELDVRGDISVPYANVPTNYGIRFYNGSRDNWSSIRNTHSSSGTATLEFRTGLGPAINILHNKNVGIGTDSPVNNLTVYTTSSYGGMDIDNGSYRHTIGNRGNTVDIIANRDNDDAAGDIRFHVGGAGQEKMIIERSGDVGIGTLTPSNRLQVYKNNAGGAVYIDYQNTWSAANLSEFSNTPFVINTRSSGAQLRFSGGSDWVSTQAVSSDLSTARDLIINPFGGNVGIGGTYGTNPNSLLTIGDFDTTLTSKPQGEQKLLHIDDSYVMRVAREHGTGDIATVGWYNVAKIPPFGSSGKVTVSIGGDFTADVVVIEWISSHNTALNNGLGAPQLSAKSTFAHTAWNSDPRISNARVARDNTTGTYYVQVYVSTGVNNNTEGKSLIEVYQGAYVEQDDTNIQAMFTYYSGSPSHYFECPIVRNGTGYTGVHVRHEQPSVNLTSSTASTSITQNSTWQKLPINQERWDVGNYYDTSTQRFTAAATGKYLFGINLQLENASGIVWTYIVPLINGAQSVTNGNNMADFTPPNTTYYNQSATWILNLTALDYVELWTIGSGGSYNFKGGTESSVFIHLL